MVRNIPARRRSPWLSLVARMRAPPLGVRKGSLRNHPSPRHNCRHHPIDESSHRSRANRATAPDCRGRRLGPTRGEQCFLEPNKNKDGNVAIVISGLDKRIEILRGGVLIGQASISFADAETSLPEALYVELQPSAANLRIGVRC